MGGRGNPGTRNQSNENISDEEMQKSMAEEFSKINSLLDSFLQQKGEKNKFGNTSFKSLNDLDTDKLLDGYGFIEKDTVQNVVKDYIDEFNNNLKSYGDGFSYWDEDQVINILYKDGKTVTISPQWWNETKKINKAGIDSIIVDSGWGTLVAGKSIELNNYRETTDYDRKYGYKNVKERYEDFNDIRATFKERKH